MIWELTDVNALFHKVRRITEGDFKLEYQYGPDNQRKVFLLNYQGAELRKVTYSGNYEKIEVGGQTYEVHYIFGGSGMAAVNVRHNGTDALYYVYTDHLGSILSITNASGSVIYKQNFDPWGRERNPDDWSYSANPYNKPPWLIRGFTGHEHLPEFSLINMNGRMYDPLLGRMLSPDNYVQFSGTMSVGMYELQGRLNYSKYMRSGVNFDNRWNWSSVVINRYDASFNSVVGPGSTMTPYTNDYFVRYQYYQYFFGY